MLWKRSACTRDRCDGTRTDVGKGRVSVLNRETRKSTTVRAGQSYLVKAKLFAAKQKGRLPMRLAALTLVLAASASRRRRGRRRRRRRGVHDFDVTPFTVGGATFHGDCRGSTFG